MKLQEDFTTRSRLADLGRWHVSRFVRDVAATLPPGTLLLDAGAGECAYKSEFRHCRYVSIDLAVGEEKWNYANLDTLGRLDHLPFREGTFDAILCTQALEHVEWPRESVSEFFRVLKSGGRLFLTVPMSHAEHQMPHDYFRYTSAGLRSICAGGGFRRLEIVPFGGLFTRLAYELPRVLLFIPGTGLGSGTIRLKGLLLFPVRALAWTIVRLLQLLFLSVEPFDRIKNDPFGWSVVAEK